MHAGNGGRNVIGNDKGVGVSERVGRRWNFTGLVFLPERDAGNKWLVFFAGGKLKKSGEYLIALNP